MKNSSSKKTAAALIWVAVCALAFFLIGKASPSRGMLAVGYALLAFCAAVYGPAAGLLAGLAGGFLLRVPAADTAALITAGCSALFGLGVGLSTRKLTLSDGVFSKHDALGFNAAQGAAHLCVWALVSPLLTYLTARQPFAPLCKAGLIDALVFLAVTAVVGTLLLFANAALTPKKGRSRKKD